MEVQKHLFLEQAVGYVKAHPSSKIDFSGLELGERFLNIVRRMRLKVDLEALLYPT
jgi:hypothetical protein